MQQSNHPNRQFTLGGLTGFVLACGGSLGLIMNRVGDGQPFRDTLEGILMIVGMIIASGLVGWSVGYLFGGRKTANWLFIMAMIISALVIAILVRNNTIKVFPDWRLNAGRSAAALVRSLVRWPSKAVDTYHPARDA